MAVFASAAPIAIECLFECPCDPLHSASGRSRCQTLALLRFRVLNLSSELLGGAWRIRTADSLACQRCGTPCAGAFKGVHRDAQFGPHSVPTPGLGSRSTDIG